jgi:hypothetical protein
MTAGFMGNRHPWLYRFVDNGHFFALWYSTGTAAHESEQLDQHSSTLS